MIDELIIWYDDIMQLLVVPIKHVWFMIIQDSKQRQLSTEMSIQDSL